MHAAGGERDDSIGIAEHFARSADHGSAKFVWTRFLVLLRVVHSVFEKGGRSGRVPKLVGWCLPGMPNSRLRPHLRNLRSHSWSTFNIAFIVAFIVAFYTRHDSIAAQCAIKKVNGKDTQKKGAFGNKPSSIFTRFFFFSRHNDFVKFGVGPTHGTPTTQQLATGGRQNEMRIFDTHFRQLWHVRYSL